MMVAGMGLMSVGTAVAQTGGYNPPPPEGAAGDPNTTLQTTCVMGPGVTCPTITVTDPDIDSKLVGGTLQSTPVALPVTQAANDTVVFKDVKLPADFERGANHSLTVVDQATGQVVAREVFGVSASGAVTAPIPASGSKLPKTGTDYVDPALKAGGALLVAGGAAVLVARRRKAGATAAAA